MYTIPMLPVDEFDWITWLNGADIWTLLGFRPRWFNIIDNANLLRQFAIGYIPGYKLSCRPELDEMAVMFLIDEVMGWTHFRKNEFEEVFNVK